MGVLELLVVVWGTIIASSHAMYTDPEDGGESTAGRACVTYRFQPVENTAEHVSDPSLNTRAKQGQLLCPHRKFNDFPKVAFAVRATQPESTANLLHQLPTKAAHEVVVWFDGPPTSLAQETRELQALQAALPNENHFLVYSSRPLGEARAFNRMAKFSQNAELVVLTSDVHARLFTHEFLSRVQDAFAARPALALLGCASGKVGSKVYGVGGEAVGEMKLVDKVLGVPMVVRRSAFLALGLFAHMQCPGECEAGYEQELSLRAWLAGFEVALLPPPEAPEAGECAKQAIPGLYSMEALNTMKANVAAARAQAAHAPSMQNCSGLPVPRLPQGYHATCEGLDDFPKAALMVQYFKRPKNIKAIMKGITNTPESTEVFINNDSGGDHAAWRGELVGGNRFLVYSHDIHEIRAYNRLGLMANSEMLVTLQDDDVPTGRTWLKQALGLFAAHPRLTYMTGYRARAGAGGNVGLGRDKVSVVDPKTGTPFQFVYKLVAGPLFMRRSTWLDLGMFNMNFSCAGDPGIHFEYEYSLRTWFRDYQAGIYDCGFEHHVGDWKNTGTRANKVVEARRRTIGMRNSMNVKFMFRNLHGGHMAPLSQKAHRTHVAHSTGQDVDMAFE